MTKPSIQLNRRSVIKGLTAGAAMPFVMWPSSRALGSGAKHGGTLTTVAWPGTTYMNSAITTSGPEAFLSPKMFDGLLGYDFGMQGKPALATSWNISEDGLRVTFNLRPNVKWHDGQPFTARDVAFTFMEVIKVHHGRGRTLFADLLDVETPDDLTAVFVLKRPAPAIMKALDGRESPILPSHLYAGTDIMENPHNIDPVGTGAFKFVSHERGVSVVMERNPDYWDGDLPYLDRIIVQYISDPSTRTAMLEAGQADVVFLNFLPALDTLRLAEKPEFAIDLKGYETSVSQQQMDFNLERPLLQDARVRHAIAHAIDRAWIVKNVWHGFGEPGATPLHHEQVSFYNTDGVPGYEFDPGKAEALLDEAGHPRGANGMRFELTIDPTPYGNESVIAAEYMREQMRQIGIDLKIRTQDYAVFIKRVWTDRDFDLSLYTAAMGADPTIGVQRFYWSKNFKPGVAFSNGSSYSNPKVDALLEASQVELDLATRQQQFHEFQKIAMTELPTLPIVSTTRATIAHRKVKDHTVDALGSLGNLAHCWLDENA